MNIITPNSRPAQHILLPNISAAVGLAALVCCQNILALDAPHNNEISQFRVHESLEVDLGNRKITFNRIEPPVLKLRQIVLDKPPAVAATPVQLTPEEQAEALRWEQMDYQTFYPSATAYEGKGSEVFVWTQDGGVRFLSSIDFRYFQPVYGFEGEGVYYSTFFMLELWTEVAVEEAKLEDPSLAIEYPNFPQEVDGVSQFEVISPTPGEENEKAIAAMEALHSYYDQDRTKLIKEYQDAEAARIVHEQWLKNNPPIPQDTVINYFPIRSDHAKTNEGADLGQ